MTQTHLKFQDVLLAGMSSSRLAILLNRQFSDNDQHDIERVQLFVQTCRDMCSAEAQSSCEDLCIVMLFFYRADGKAEMIKRLAQDFAARCQTQCETLQQEKEQLAEDLSNSIDIRRAQSSQLKTVSDARDALDANNEELRESLDRYGLNRPFCRQLQHTLSDRHLSGTC